MNTMTSTALSIRDPWSLVPPIGNLDAYIAAVNRIPLLTQKEESDCAQRLQQQGDVEACGWWCRCRGSTSAMACPRAT
jgi:RNA polymerase sigma-32 factor